VALGCRDNPSRSRIFVGGVRLLFRHCERSRAERGEAKQSSAIPTENSGLLRREEILNLEAGVQLGWHEYWGMALIYTKKQ